MDPKNIVGIEDILSVKFITIYAMEDDDRRLTKGDDNNLLEHFVLRWPKNKDKALIIAQFCFCLFFFFINENKVFISVIYPSKDDLKLYHLDLKLLRRIVQFYFMSIRRMWIIEAVPYIINISLSEFGNNFLFDEVQSDFLIFGNFINVKAHTSVICIWNPLLFLVLLEYYAAFNIISVISLRQFTYSWSLGKQTSTRLENMPCPRGLPHDRRAATGDQTRDTRFLIPDANHSTTEDSKIHCSRRTLYHYFN